MSMEKNNTKSKILEVAGRLFIEKGYHGASIRDIASEAGVNLGAVNYHFKNKDNLLFTILIDNKEFIDSEFEKVSENSSSFKEFAYGCYKVFETHCEKIIAQYKLFLNKSVIEKIINISFEQIESGDEKFGPPGLDMFHKLLEKEYGDSLSLKAKMWIFDKIHADMSEQMVRSYGRQFIPENKLIESDFFKKLDEIGCLDVMSKKWVYLYLDCIVDYALNNPEAFE